MINKTNLDGVVVTYHQIVPEDKQMPDFYVDGTSCTDVATLEYKDRVLHICRNGEMYISIPTEEWEGYDKQYTEKVIRYSDDLEYIAKDDFDLRELMTLWCINREYEIFHESPWWELYNEDHFPDGIVCDDGDFYAAIDMAINLIKNDEEWN